MTLEVIYGFTRVILETILNVFVPCCERANTEPLGEHQSVISNN